MNSRTFHLHLVSDATGETVITVARGAVAQFSDVEAIEHLWSLVRSEKQLKRVLSSVAANPGVVMFTLVDAELRQKLQEGCRELDVPCVPLLDTVIATLSRYLGVESQNLPGSQHVMDGHYIDRIEAVNFAVLHDDGQAGLLPQLSPTLDVVSHERIFDEADDGVILFQFGDDGQDGGQRSIVVEVIMDAETIRGDLFSLPRLLEDIVVAA